MIGLLVATAIAVAFGGRWLEESSSFSSFSGALPSAPVERTVDVLRGARGRESGESGGAVPDGTTAFDDEIPGIEHLDSSLLEALRAASTDAADAGVALMVTSGWRAPEYQQRLLDEGIAKYGSEQEAARWVATPETSAHVSGDAVDVGPYAATAWLFEHGARYGLCQIYRNESWHYELRPDAVDHGCPAMYADATEDPRMRR
ncbi:MAG: M15 family metallopeptidase [Patulibacter sp.]|nr:M15 family metallopeptidase [Patulibacter sp.]